MIQKFSDSELRSSNCHSHQHRQADVLFSTESEDSSRRRHAAEFWGGKEAKQLKKRKAAEQKLEDEENEIARFLSCSVSSLGLSKHDLTDDMCGSIDEITKGSAITTALSSAD